MTCGIYKLTFSNTEKCYIGQSIDIEKRILQHLADMRNNRSSIKLQQAYTKYGKPSYEIILECTIDELYASEKEAIEIYNSVDNGFNTYKDASEAPIGTGQNSGNAKYSNEDILKAAKLLTNPNLTAKYISLVTGISEDVVSAVSSLKLHYWIAEKDPETYAILKSLKNKRVKLNAYDRGDKISAKAQGIIYPKLISPAGSIYEVENAYAFARQHGLRGNHLTEVLNGHRKSHLGWKVWQQDVGL